MDSRIYEIYLFNILKTKAYRKKNQFIATQLPLVNTMTDFWQMIEEYRVSVIVQLDPCKVCSATHILFKTSTGTFALN